jgi:hypothetical protein
MKKTRNPMHQPNAKKNEQTRRDVPRSQKSKQHNETRNRRNKQCARISKRNTESTPVKKQTDDNNQSKQSNLKTQQANNTQNRDEIHNEHIQRKKTKNPKKTAQPSPPIRAHYGVTTSSKGPVAGEVQDITMRGISPVYGPIEAGRVKAADEADEEGEETGAERDETAEKSAADEDNEEEDTEDEGGKAGE